MIRTVILEGVDRTGKDSIRHEIVKQSNGKIVVMCRSYISQIVYSRIYNRNINEQEYYNLIEKTKEIGYEYYILTADYQVLLERFKATNELMIDIKRDLTAFENIAKELNIKLIDTSFKTPNELAKEIL
jgi:thymidylate kinase